MNVIKIAKKASISLQLMSLAATPRIRSLATARLAGFSGPSASAPTDNDATTAVIIDTRDADKTGNQLVQLGAKRVVGLAERFISARIPLAAVPSLIADPTVRRVQSLKLKKPSMDSAVIVGGLISGGTRSVAQTGKGVLVGIVDTGFDLSHPMYRDAAGALRVEALLDQTGDPDREYTTAQLEAGWAGASRPGFDRDGHGTHVASIAAGSPFGGLAGVAPDARFLLVKSDFLDLATAVKWIFDKAGARPCVVNMSLGHHFGAHDGTDSEERFFDTITGPGRIIVAAAGNEREDEIHVGGRFVDGQSETIQFDIFPRRPPEPPAALLTFWHDRADRFDLSVLGPLGTRLKMPASGTAIQATVEGATVKFARTPYEYNGLMQVQISVEFSSIPLQAKKLSGWSIRVVCKKASIGRIDGWFSNSGYGRFRGSHLLETARTIGMPATGKNVLAVASHVSKAHWRSDDGDQKDQRVVVGRSSSFSSRGPTRDGRQKPEVSAPGQYLTAALARDSDNATDSNRALTQERLLSIEGTSMASPFMAGVVALMLEKEPKLSPGLLRERLRAKAVRDDHTGPIEWSPEYGHGKISAAGILT